MILKRHCRKLAALWMLWSLAAFTETAAAATNLIPNGDFAKGQPGGLPEGWQAVAARPSLAPLFKLVTKDGEQFLEATGNGKIDCVGLVQTPVTITRGKTYLFRVRFKKSDTLDPQQNLLFQVFANNLYDGIFVFRRLAEGWIEGEAKIRTTGAGDIRANVRILYRFSADAKAWIREITLSETDPVAPRWVRVACTQGAPNLDNCTQALDAAGQAGADLALMTEYMAGGYAPKPETVPDGPCCKLLSSMAAKYQMYVAGGIVRRVEATDRWYNSCVLFDRAGKLVGWYDKLHPFSPEVDDEGISPGMDAPVFRTDFGTVGVMTCSDNWNCDVAQLMGLKGAEILLFPNMGCVPELLIARAADNCVRVVNSSWNMRYGVWDTMGREAPRAGADFSSPLGGVTLKDVTETQAGGLKVLLVTLDLNNSPSMAWSGGPMHSATGGRRNRRDMLFDMEGELKKEVQRWWSEDTSPTTQTNTRIPSASLP